MYTSGLKVSLFCLFLAGGARVTGPTCDLDSKAYRILDKEKQRILKSHDVIFLKKKRCLPPHQAEVPVEAPNVVVPNVVRRLELLDELMESMPTNDPPTFPPHIPQVPIADNLDDVIEDQLANLSDEDEPIEVN